VLLKINVLLLAYQEVNPENAGLLFKPVEEKKRF